MTDRPEWFAPKTYGYGAGLPISWQGWALTIGFGLAAAGLSMEFRERPLPLFASLIPLIATFAVIAARTTKGGWRWRWGKGD